MHQLLDISKNLEYWDDSMKIYNDSFPEWEREQSSNILLNIKNGSYKMFSYLQKGEVVGFYILDINRQLSYALFSFLAIKESHRAKGLGSKLCLNAIEYFQNSTDLKWLLIEAQERQAKLYEKLGFSRLLLDYRVPEFHSPKSVPMSLLLIQKESPLMRESLEKIIRDIFQRGYSLHKDDKRIEEQLERLKQK